MSENNLIKSITTHTCPHCKGEIFVENQMTPPMVSSVFTQKELDSAKEDLLERIAALAISDEKRDAVVKWINAPDTIFGPGEVENIILSLLKPEE